VLGGMSRAPHGDLNAAILPHVIAYNAPSAAGAIGSVAEAFGTGDAARGLQGFAASIGAPTSLDEIGIERQSLEAAAKAVFDKPFWNPRPPTREDVLSLLDAAFRGEEARIGDRR
jgi:maleylacetate reductase